MKKTIKKETPQGLLEIHISTDGCNGKPYFSVTADFYENRESGNKSPRRWTMGGCLHEEIISADPELRPLVNIHLSDMDGIPMHAEANGWYWLAKAAGIPQKYEPDQSELDSFALFMSHARMEGKEAHELLKEIKFAENPREKWGELCEAMKPRWKKEAAEALDMIEKL